MKYLHFRVILVVLLLVVEPSSVSFLSVPENATENQESSPKSLSSEAGSAPRWVRLFKMETTLIAAEGWVGPTNGKMDGPTKKWLKRVYAKA